MKYLNRNKSLNFIELKNHNGYDLVYKISITTVLSSLLKHYIINNIVNDSSKILRIGFRYMTRKIIIIFDFDGFIDVTKEFNENKIDSSTHHIYGSYLRKDKRNIYLVVDIVRKKKDNNTDLQLVLKNEK